MDIREAQRDVREIFLGGFPGLVVSGALWLVSAAVSTWVSPRGGILVLVVGGAFIFPITQLFLKLLGRKASLPAGHPMNALAMQIAFMVPLCLPVVAGAALYKLSWFYPAMMVVVGAHYLPFAFLYGMKHFLAIAAILIAGGVTIGMRATEPFTLGGWAGALVLLSFAIPNLMAAGSAPRGAPGS